jgi:predicted transcriptional regulator
MIKRGIVMPRRKLSDEEKLVQAKKKVYDKILSNTDITITELAKLLGKTSSTIRKWEDLKIIPKTDIVSGTRLYNLRQLRDVLCALYEHKWERNTLNREEIKTIMDYLDSVVSIETTTRTISKTPYEFKGDLY